MPEILILAIYIAAAAVLAAVMIWNTRQFRRKWDRENARDLERLEAEIAEYRRRSKARRVEESREIARRALDRTLEAERREVRE